RDVEAEVRGGLQQHGLAAGGEVAGVLEDGLDERPEHALGPRLLRRLGGDERVLVPLEREVAQVDGEGGAVAVPQGSDVVERAVAVRALQFAPVVEVDESGVAHGASVPVVSRSGPAGPRPGEGPPTPRDPGTDPEPPVRSWRPPPARGTMEG